MKKTLLTICALFVSISIQAQTNEVKKAIIKPSFSVEAGYTDTIVSKGVNYTGEAARYIGLSLHSPAENNFIPVDLYGNGMVIAENTDSFWSVGGGKTIAFEGTDKYALRLDAVFTTRRTDLDVPRNNEIAGTVGLVTPWVTPFVGYTHDWRLEQNGLTFGLTKSYSVELQGEEWFTFAPKVAYHVFEDYEAAELGAKLALTKWQLSPFVSVNYVDNDFDTQNFNFATEEIDGDVIWSGGLSINF